MQLWLFRVTASGSVAHVESLPPLHTRIIAEIDSALLCSEHSDNSAVSLLNLACRNLVLAFLFPADDPSSAWIPVRGRSETIMADAKGIELRFRPEEQLLTGAHYAVACGFEQPLEFAVSSVAIAATAAATDAKSSAAPSLVLASLTAEKESTRIGQEWQAFAHPDFARSVELPPCVDLLHPSLDEARRDLRTLWHFYVDERRAG